MNTNAKTSHGEAKNTDVIILGIVTADTKGPGGALEFMGKTIVPGISAD